MANVFYISNVEASNERSVPITCKTEQQQTATAPHISYMQQGPKHPTVKVAECCSSPTFESSLIILVRPPLTRAGGALQASPLPKRGFGFRLPLFIVSRGRRGGGWHLPSCALVTAEAEWVRAGARGRTAGQQDPHWAGRSSSAEEAPPPCRQRVDSHAAPPWAIRQPVASPISIPTGGHPP